MGCGASNSATSAVSSTPNLNNPNINTANRNAAGNTYTRRLGSRPVIQSKSYRHGSTITQSELNNQRTEFWATRTDGNTHMWQAIQSAADAVLSSDLRLANAILEASNITTPNGLLEYKVPLYCIANPFELVQDSQTDRPNSDGSGPGEAEVVEDTSPPITVKKVSDVGFEEAKVVQIFLRPQAK
eukprot:gene33658-43499_t